MVLLFSVALVVDNSEMFNRVANTFYSTTTMRFIILLWGEKSELVAQQNKHIPVFTFTQLIDLGAESRTKLSKPGMLSHSLIIILFLRGISLNQIYSKLVIIHDIIFLNIINYLRFLFQNVFLDNSRL